MKAYSFYFNATDWLASPLVKLMTKAERGCYIDLLAIAWNQKEPGTLPASEDKVRRLAELTPAEWEVSKEALLEVFPLSECKTFRYNQRLLEEVEKQRELSEKNSRNGQKSAERRAAEKAAKEAAAEAQRLANQNSTVVAPNPTTVEPTGNQLPNETSTKLSQAKQSSNEDEERTQGSSSSDEPSSLNAEKEKPAQTNTAPHPAASLTDPLDEQPLDQSPLTKPRPFQIICDRNLFVGINYELYRLQAYNAAVRSKAKPRTVSQWEGWIVKYLNNNGGPTGLLKPGQQAQASPDPESDRLRAVAAQVKQQQPVAGYEPFVSKPNTPGTVAEPAPAYGASSTTRGF